MHKSSGSAMGFLLGLGVGAAAGILLAPRKGEETRRQLQEKAMHARDKMKHQKDKAADTSRQMASTVQDKMDEASRGRGGTTTR